MSNNPRQVPFGVGLYKAERNEGEIFDAEGVRFTWKVKAKDSGYAFSIYYRDLEPGDGVPLHYHACSEVFYLLSGNIVCLRVTDANEEWITCSDGETIIIPINALHAFYNRTEKPARFLNISTQLHQAHADSLRRH